MVPLTKKEAIVIRKMYPKLHITKSTRHGQRFMEENKQAMDTLQSLRNRNNLN